MGMAAHLSSLPPVLGVLRPGRPAPHRALPQRHPEGSPGGRVWPGQPSPSPAGLPPPRVPHAPLGSRRMASGKRGPPLRPSSGSRHLCSQACSAGRCWRQGGRRSWRRGFGVAARACQKESRGNAHVCQLEGGTEKYFRGVYYFVLPCVWLEPMQILSRF